MARVADRCRWEHDGEPFFAGEAEPCINGRVVALGVYFGHDVDGIVTRLRSDQLEDGGWNCEAEYGSVRSSFDTTINVLEGLLAHERATGGSAGAVAARRRGEEYLLQRNLMRRKSTGEVVRPTYLPCSFPTRPTPGSTRRSSWSGPSGGPTAPGRWSTPIGRGPLPAGDGDGRPSRWNTLRALRVLDWYGQDPPAKPGQRSGRPAAV